ncbi:FAD-dependent monooxygenase [Microbacterium sp. ARD32]|uniref:FAD-dependent monooxygenase n=1 Tax=Microbacterium sp. ARD32 TaxID=2962577 RepID=UPI0028825EBD|nr:FAD-dependent monooxygenase [Microbacterium sp. ARD32]MDT0156204.1 FAD-dependent monooxygenase [Microbacterium sp. ARD32]
MNRKRVLISGASIAGLTSAYWLQRNGFAVTIVEIAARPRSGGQAVDLRGAGREVVQRMGLLDEARELGLTQAGMSWVDAESRVRAAMPADAFGGEGFISEIEILRGDLVELLHCRLREDVEWIFGDTITGLAQDAHGVNVTFRGMPQRRFDFVIGADGLHSTVRTIAFGMEDEAVHPLGLYTAWFTAPAFDGLDDWYQLYNHRGGLVASIRPGRRPEESKAALSFRTRPGVRVSYDRRDRASQLALLEDRFAGVGWHVPRLLEAAHSASDFSFDSMGKVRMSRWWIGRIALVGDAAACPTPLSGLGTSVALVGAYVLAGELGGGDDHATGFAEYDRVVRPYADGAQELAGGAGGYAPMTAPAIRLMQASMAWAMRWPMRGFMQKQFSKSADIELPRYAEA